MRDALAHLHHRERPPRLCLDELHDLGVGRLTALDEQLHRRDRPSDVVADRGVRTPRTRREQNGGDEQAPHPPHQNECLTRNSSA